MSGVKIAIMQPYFFPYIGYFQLMNIADHFIVYDNIEYTKKGWINRNRILVNGKDVYISLPIKNDSDYLQIKERELAEVWFNERKKLLNRLSESYRKAPYFESVYPIAEACILFDESNLFQFIFHSLNLVKDYLGIQTPLVISSSLPIDSNLKGEEKVIEICNAMNATSYINPIGGLNLYNKQRFSNNGIELDFLKTGNIVYPQFNNPFISSLSILDVMMFNSKEIIEDYLNNFYTLV